MMKGKQKIIPGSIIKIKFDDTHHTYARILNHGDIALYDFKTIDDIFDFDKIVGRPLIYKMTVNGGSIMDGTWPVVGSVPLEAGFKNSIYYLEDFGNRDMVKILENGNIVRRVPKAEAIGLEVGSVWNSTHVEEFLRDYYSGKENISLKLSDVLQNYKSMLKKPLSS